MKGVFKQEINREYNIDGIFTFETKSLTAPGGQQICWVHVSGIGNPPNTTIKELRLADQEAIYTFGYLPNGSYENYFYRDEIEPQNDEKDGGSFDDLPVLTPMPGIPIDWEYFRTDVFDPTPFLIP